MSVLESIGRTPLVGLGRINPNPRVRLLAKLEGANPAGSIKDRPALYMIRRAEAEGLLTPEKTILEATSGNTGIGLAMVAAAKGYGIRLVMPACVSEERRSILRAFGADLVLTQACMRTDGAILRAREIFDEDPDRYFMPDQFSNPANVEAHYETTAPEIWEQTRGEVTEFVAGMGTTGTLMGVSRGLKERNAEVRIIGVEPCPGHAIQGLKNMCESIVPRIYDPSRLDDRVTVSDEDAFRMTRRLVLEEGIFAGMSSGAAVAGAVREAERSKNGATIVVLLPDRGDRYLSTTLYRSICAECPP
ncbi:MAG: cysteine synthase family protein [Planctomycetes bacterium]|nr:cysteine synthase family protein [Planctomycetota bacterium]